MKRIWPDKRYDKAQNNRYSENKRRIHAIKLQVEKDQKNADRLAEEQLKQAQETVFSRTPYPSNSAELPGVFQAGIFSIQSIFTTYLDLTHYKYFNLKTTFKWRAVKKYFLKRKGYY